jgi:hypothetical protein
MHDRYKGKDQCGDECVRHLSPLSIFVPILTQLCRDWVKVIDQALGLAGPFNVIASLLTANVLSHLDGLQGTHRH